MAPLKASIAARVVMVVVAIHAVLLPALYLGLGLVILRSHGELFLLHVRTSAHNLVEELEAGDLLDTSSRVGELLDLAVTKSDAVYAEVIDQGRMVRSSLNLPGLKWPGRQDFHFSDSQDHLYWILAPVAHKGRQAEMRIAFDEQPTLDQVRLAKARMLGVIAVYVVVAVALSIVLARRFARPIVKLSDAARRIASGDTAQSLQLASRVLELHELGAALERMRTTLVGVNERLRAEIGERERADRVRGELETRLRHRDRVETIGTLAGGIAHEINNALQPIMLLSEAAMADVPAGSPVRADLEAILTSARHAKDIVVKVLTFSREAGDVKLEPIELGPVVREALRLFGLMVPASLDLRTSLGGPLPPVRVDAALTVQLVVNLCTNGYQAMSGRPGALTVSLDERQVEVAERDLAPGRYVVLSVADAGHGMSPATRARIFEPFFTTREVGSGSGLGLAVVHGIAERFGATILVESEVDKGSTFRVCFPVADDRAAVDAVAVADEGPR